MNSYPDKNEGVFAPKTEPYNAKNEYILKWWSHNHDELITVQIKNWQWHWYYFITDAIVQVTPSVILNTWRQEDPLCSNNAWQNVLSFFAIARAREKGLTKEIRNPTKKICLLCREEFFEDGIPYSVIRRIGTEHLDFCRYCLQDRLYQNTGNHLATESQTISYLQELTNLLGHVPTQGYGEGIDDLLELSANERLALLDLFGRKVSTSRIKELFGSWLNALIQAGILEDGTRKTSRGVQCLATDGHVCLSLGEKTIDDFLSSHGIIHEKEPRYPIGNYRADFKVGDTFIEFFGLIGNPEYDAKTEEKIRICKTDGIKLVAIYPIDIVSATKLATKLLPLVDCVP